MSKKFIFVICGIIVAMLAVVSALLVQKAKVLKLNNVTEASEKLTMSDEVAESYFSAENKSETEPESQTEETQTDEDYDTCYYYVNTESSNLNIRAQKSTSSEVLCQKPKGNLLKVHSFDDDWAYVEYYPGSTGWTKAEYLKKVPKSVSQYMSKYENVSFYSADCNIQVDYQIENREKYDSMMNQFYTKKNKEKGVGFTSFAYYGAFVGEEYFDLYYIDMSFLENPSSDDIYGAVYMISTYNDDCIYSIAGNHLFPACCHGMTPKEICQKTRNILNKEYPDTGSHNLYIYGSENEIYVQDKTNRDFYILNFDFEITDKYNDPDAMEDHPDDFAWHE